MKAEATDNNSKRQNWRIIRRILCVQFLLCTILAVVIGWCGPQDALVTAARNGDMTEVKFWTLLGADPSRVGWEDHFTPLGAASHSGRTEIVRYLVDWGTDVNRRDDNKCTALHWATYCNHPEIAAILEQAGATE